MAEIACINIIQPKADPDPITLLINKICIPADPFLRSIIPLILLLHWNVGKACDRRSGPASDLCDIYRVFSSLQNRGPHASESLGRPD